MKGQVQDEWRKVLLVAVYLKAAFFFNWYSFVSKAYQHELMFLRGFMYGTFRDTTVRGLTYVFYQLRF